MCRWVAYHGDPIYVDTLVTRPSHSLVDQSLNTEKNFNTDGSLWSVNGDGFGIGWYTDKFEAALFKDTRPAWNDENLHEICASVKSKIFMAHIRATTTGSVQRNNSHPFKYKNWLFQHNGHMENFDIARRDLQMDISPELYRQLKGTTDSETFFLLALTYGLETDPKTALQKMIRRIEDASEANRIELILNLSCTISDGEKLYTIRYAANEKTKSQYYSNEEGCIKDINSGCAMIPSNSVIVVSEPLDELGKKWNEVPENSFMTVADGDVHIETLMD